MPASKNTSPASTSTSKTTRARKSTRSSPVSEQERLHMISEAAYFMAEHRGFVPGNEIQDWLQAEAQVDARLHH